MRDGSLSKCSLKVTKVTDSSAFFMTLRIGGSPDGVFHRNQRANQKLTAKILHFQLIQSSSNSTVTSSPAMIPTLRQMATLTGRK